MNKLLQLCITIFAFILVSCAINGLKAVDPTISELDAKFILQEYGIKYNIPSNLRLMNIFGNIGEEDFECVYADKDRESQFSIAIYKNYCNLNIIDPNYAWGYLKGCVAASMKLLEKKHTKLIDSSYHVYSAQGVYFKTGSFVIPTLVFDKKVKFEKFGNKFRYKSLGYAYEYNDAYYLIEIGYITKEIDNEYNTAVFSGIVNSIAYPKKANK